jgi:PAT family beta-lactamase induction signal transducer AmpG
MPHRETTKPFIFFFLVLPHGVSSGFVSITLPFVLTRAGFSVAIAASIVAIGVSANLWRFLWGPIADLTLTARRWYLIRLSAAALTLFLLGLFPLNPDTVGMLMAIVFISQVASTFIVLPVGGFTLPFQQWSCLRLDAVPRQRNTRRFRRSATCLSFT